MKKILGISLCALFAVSAANANIASTEWVNQQVNGMDLTATTGDYVKVVSQTDGKVSATAASFADAVTADGTNAPKSSAVASHVTTYVTNNAVNTVVEGTDNGTIKVDGTDVRVHGLGSAAYVDADTLATTASLKALAYKDTVATANIDDDAVTTGKIANGTITNDDISATAKIAMSKIDFTGEQTGAIDSGIDSTKVAQIATNAGDITTLKQNILDVSDVANASKTALTPTTECQNNADGCTLVYRNNQYSWEKITREAQ